VAAAAAPAVPVLGASSSSDRARGPAASAATKAPEKETGKSGKDEARKFEPAKSARAAPAKSERERVAAASKRENASDKATDKTSGKAGTKTGDKSGDSKVAPRAAPPKGTGKADAASERPPPAVAQRAPARSADVAPKPAGKGGDAPKTPDKAGGSTPKNEAPGEVAARRGEPPNDGTVIAKAQPRAEPDAANAPAAAAPPLPGAKQTPRGTVIMLGNDQFNLHQAYLRAGATRALDPLAEFLRQQPERRVRIEGFTDNAASAGENQRLSLERANEVRKALIRRGVASDRIQTVGHGAAQPIASNDTPAGREQNRRVEIIISDERGNPARR
jgi:outer membrane protein OmpA-like peptidoglycan-associated protein